MITPAVARRILRGQGMPPREIRALLATDDPLLVHRLVELHRERLGEWLEEQRRLVTGIERSLVGEADTAHRRSAVRQHAVAGRGSSGRGRDVTCGDYDPGCHVIR